MGEPSDSLPAREHLFAYGTLVSGGPPGVAQAMAAWARAIGPASVAGRLHNAGDWPAMVAAHSAADRVPGWLYAVLDPRRLWPVLDAWEGCGADDPPPPLFHRRRVETHTPEGVRQDAFAYFFAGDASGWPRIDRWPPDPGPWRR